VKSEEIAYPARVLDNTDGLVIGRDATQGGLVHPDDIVEELAITNVILKFLSGVP